MEAKEVLRKKMKMKVKNQKESERRKRSRQVHKKVFLNENFSKSKCVMN